MLDQLEKQIESILFWKGEPVDISDLAKILSKDVSEIKNAISGLSEKMSGRGISVISNNNEVCLMTSSENSELIERLQKEELTKDLSKAALETLTIILYRGPIKRSDIDYIRGVNSQFTIRILLVRGLITKKQDPKDERAFLYESTIDTLAHLGVQKVVDLPEYEKVNSDINKFLQGDSVEKDNENQNAGNE